MPKANVVRESPFDTEIAAAPSASGSDARGDVPGIAKRVRAWGERLTDAQVALLVSATLFALTAWPVFLVDVPPYQDLPNHLAAATILNHPAEYPEFVFNGFFKTNAALFTWLYVVGKVVGLKAAARLFALLAIGLTALVLPRFVLELTGSRKKTMLAGLLAWPSVHNWFVCMGMLDFALGVPLALLVLVALNRQRTAPSFRTGIAISVLALFTWYAHVFALMVVMLLVAIHLVTRRSVRDALAEAKVLVLPLVPPALLTAWSLYIHFTEQRGAMCGFVNLGAQIPAWQLLYNLWAEWQWSFTWTTYCTLVPSAMLLLLALWRRHESVTFFSPVACLVLLILFAVTPYVATNWFHVNSRFVPFLWMAAFVRLPERFPVWPRFATGLLVVCAIVYSIGNGVDYVRLDDDRAKFTAGASVVPQGSRLLPLIFRRKLTSENTRSLQHAWGFYVLEKRTAAPLLFAHSRSFPLTYKEPPPVRFNHLVLESFAPTMTTPAWMCQVELSEGVPGNCEGEWRTRWAEFWAETRPLYDHVLMWEATPEVMALVPPDYRVKLVRDRLTILERTSAPSR
jgi:hypothetical protein